MKLKTSNKIRLFSSLLAISTVALFTSCAKQNNSVATVPASIVMTGSSATATVAFNKPNLFNFLFPVATANTPPTLIDKSGANVTLSNAWVAIEKIEFKAQEVPDAQEVAGAEDEVEFTGPYFVDLLSSNPSPIASKEMPAKAFKRIKFKLHAAESSAPGIPANLVNNSILIEGTVNGIQFSYQSKDGTEINIGGGSGVNLDGSAGLLVAIQFANVIKSINLSGITSSTVISDTNRVSGSNLCPTIDASATDLYTCFRKGFEAYAECGKDSDGDHEIGVHEEEVHRAAQ